MYILHYMSYKKNAWIQDQEVEVDWSQILLITVTYLRTFCFLFLQLWVLQNYRRRPQRQKTFASKKSLHYKLWFCLSSLDSLCTGPSRRKDTIFVEKLISFVWRK